MSKYVKEKEKLKEVFINRVVSWFVVAIINIDFTVF